MSCPYTRSVRRQAAELPIPRLRAELAIAPRIPADVLAFAASRAAIYRAALARKTRRVRALLAAAA